MYRQCISNDLNADDWPLVQTPSERFENPTIPFLQLVQRSVNDDNLDPDTTDRLPAKVCTNLMQDVLILPFSQRKRHANGVNPRTVATPRHQCPHPLKKQNLEYMHNLDPFSFGVVLPWNVWLYGDLGQDEANYAGHCDTGYVRFLEAVSR